jgi:subtilisin family serine protease
LGVTSSGEFNAWNSGQAYRWTSGHFWKGHKGQSFGKKFIEGTLEGSVGENGGSGTRTLTAGAYINRNEWTNYKGEYFFQPWNIVGDIAGFSSRGPMPKSLTHPNGRIKPDIIAPGQSITSALHRRQVPGWLNNELMYKTQYNGNDVYWAMFSGTSMAAPHTTGIVALYLQANEWLTPEEIRSLWRLTARKDQFTTKDSNGNSGYGKIDAFETLKIIDQYANIPKQHLHEGWVYFVNGNDQLVISNIKNPGGTMVSIYNCSGQIILNRQLAINDNKIDIRDVSPGVYIVKIEDFMGNPLMSGKFIK